MDTTKTNDMEVSKPSTSEVSDLSKKPTAEDQKSDCKNGVCTINWKPVKPPA